MIFFVIIPLLTGAFGNFLIPLMIGAPRHGVPEAEHVVVLVHVAGVHPDHATRFFVEGGAPAAGWTSYPILSIAKWATPGSLNGQTFWLLALLFAGISSMMGSVNYITTIIKHARARA